ncbi:MinD-like ATPase involved in chromosome partitioning or flagellar assembly [Allocatelliglobosispora scoriae]|uniref:MinD-like ATPase involved in chromosome partitioning or flagellar assembly n=1 Tax=Allocatelliglobosispora scoriae TaxID=643052 RepID=A0A841BRL7_9ACTN|nr:chromosome partitioning protein [Allocatelliglobosispora scoriae]MBB5870884.1 MinD-like ATPase involved in chromosome partitioning or flagellar assembly [Allocatelliglobosispora scoriae]
MDEDYWPEDEFDGEPTGQPHSPRAGVPFAVPAQQGIPVAGQVEVTPYEPGGQLPPVPVPVVPIPVRPHTAPITIAPQEPYRPGDGPRPPVERRTPAQAQQAAQPQNQADSFFSPQVKPLRPEPAAEPADLPQTPHSAWAQPPAAGPRPRDEEAPVTRPPSSPVVTSMGVPHQVPPAPVPRRRVEELPPEHPAPGVTAFPPRLALPAPGVIPVTPPDEGGYMPTAEEFARRRAARQPDPVAQMGIQATLSKATFGLVSLPPGRREQELRHDVELVRRNFGGLRQITVVNPKGGAGKTVAVLMLAMTFGQKRGGYVLAWDNNETQGTLGMRAQQDFHSRTVRDLLRDLYVFRGAQGRVGDLSQYVRAQGEGMFEVLASDESATAGEMLTDVAFGEIRDVVSRFYKLIVVDTGNNVRAPNWQAAVDATDQLVVTMSARNDSAETAARMLDHLEQSGRTRLVRQAVTVVSMPQHQRDLDAGAIERHFAARTRAVVPVPYERIIDTGEPIRYGQLSEATHDAWLKVAAAVAEGL